MHTGESIIQKSHTHNTDMSIIRISVVYTIYGVWKLDTEKQYTVTNKQNCAQYQSKLHKTRLLTET